MNNNIKTGDRIYFYYKKDNEIKCEDYIIVQTDIDSIYIANGQDNYHHDIRVLLSDINQVVGGEMYSTVEWFESDIKVRLDN